VDERRARTLRAARRAGTCELTLILALDSDGLASVTDSARGGHFTGALGGPLSHPSHSRSVQLEVRAREMRLSPTLSEARLWQAFRGSRLGVAFRRQAVIGDCIVDFLARCLIGGRGRWWLSWSALSRRRAARSKARAGRVSGAAFRGRAGRGRSIAGGIDHRRQSGLTGVAMAGTIRIARCWPHNGSYAHE
jgi:hypothetical protein